MADVTARTLKATVIVTVSSNNGRVSTGHVAVEAMAMYAEHDRTCCHASSLFCSVVVDFGADGHR